MDDLNCLICYSLLCEPTTMHCGHSFCRNCTIKWYVTYRNSNCPVCRCKTDKDIPKVNVTLKALIENIKLKLNDKEKIVEVNNDLDTNNNYNAALLNDCSKIELSENFINENKIELSDLFLSSRVEQPRQQQQKAKKNDKDSFLKSIFLTIIGVFLLIFLRILRYFFKN
jgi:hypothetical protein